MNPDRLVRNRPLSSLIVSSETQRRRFRFGLLHAHIQLNEPSITGLLLICSRPFVEITGRKEKDDNHASRLSNEKLWPVFLAWLACYTLNQPVNNTDYKQFLNYNQLCLGPLEKKEKSFERFKWNRLIITSRPPVRDESPGSRFLFSRFCYCIIWLKGLLEFFLFEARKNSVWLSTIWLR